MENSVKRTAEQIYEKGGIETAELLSDLFKSLYDNKGEYFEPDLEIEKIFVGLEGNKSPYDESNIGIGNGISLIPSNVRTGSCCRLCVSFATKGFKYPSLAKKLVINFNDVILLQSAYWFGCMGINVENLILTPNWNQIDFESKYQQIIDNYCNIHNKKVFIVEVSKVGLILRYPY